MLTQGPWASWSPGWAGSRLLQTGITRLSRTLMLICLKIPCVCVGGWGAVGRKHPSDMWSSGCSLFSEWPHGASNTHNQSVEWGIQKTENSNCQSHCSHTPLQGSWDTAGRGGGLTYLFSFWPHCAMCRILVP